MNTKCCCCCCCCYCCCKSHEIKIRCLCLSAYLSNYIHACAGFVCPLQTFHESLAVQIWSRSLHLSRMFVSARCGKRRLKVDIAARGQAQVVSADLVPVWLDACKFFSASIPHNLFQAKPNSCWYVEIDWPLD